MGIVLSRYDQQYLTTQYEREYGRLLMMKNNQDAAIDTQIKAENLFREVKKIASTNNYQFDEDVTEVLVGISNSLHKNFLVK